MRAAVTISKSGIHTDMKALLADDFVGVMNNLPKSIKSPNDLNDHACFFGTTTYMDCHHLDFLKSTVTANRHLKSNGILYISLYNITNAKIVNITNVTTSLLSMTDSMTRNGQIITYAS